MSGSIPETGGLCSTLQKWSSGLGAVISALKKIGNKGKIVICCVKETVMSLFHLTRMDRVFDIFSSEEDALKAFGEKV